MNLRGNSETNFKNKRRTHQLKSNKGAVSIFLCIILLAVVILAGFLIDASRISNGGLQVQRAIQAAIESALACYDGKLKNEYGIFALAKNIQSGLEETIKKYMGKNLSVEKTAAGFIDLYDFRIEDIKVTPIFNLSENAVVKNQILEFMKYRAPKEFIEDFFKRISSIKDAGKMAEACSKKMDIDRSLGEISKVQQKLKKNISGTTGDGSDEPVYICKFNEKGFMDSAIVDFSGLMAKYRTTLHNLDSINGNITELNSGLKNEKDKSKKEVLQKELDMFIIDEKAISKQVEILCNEIHAVALDLRSNHIAAFISPNEEAVKNINEIVRLGSETDNLIKSLEEYLTRNFREASGIAADFRDIFLVDAGNFKKLFPDAAKAQEIIKAAESNCKLLTSACGRLDEIVNNIGSYTVDNELSQDEMIEQLSSFLALYNNKINYIYAIPRKSSNSKDPREEQAGKANNRVNMHSKNKDNGKDNLDINISDKEINIAELPSHKKINSNGEANDGKTTYGDTLPIHGNNIDFMNKDGGASKKSFDFLSTVGNIISGNLGALRDELYLDEYIMGIFKNTVSDPKDNSRETFFNSETEYILNGNPSQRVNKLLTETQILLIRFGLDTLHVYMDARKKELAFSIAAAVAGWWTGGAGIPIVSNLIMCSWGMGEALIDLQDLMDGKSVPLYKTSADWKLDIGLPIGKSAPDKLSATGSMLDFSYSDYLRLLLILKKPDEKIDRIEDLIELNMQKSDNDFKMTRSNTYLKVEAGVSMKYLFLTQPFIPQYRKAGNGRHLFKVLLYDGY